MLHLYNIYRPEYKTDKDYLSLYIFYNDRLGTDNNKAAGL